MIFSSEEFASIILQIIITATFIIIFFFTYGSYLEKKVLNEQMDYIVSDLVGNIKTLSPEVASALKISLASVPKPNLEMADKIAAENNNILTRNTLILIGIVLLFGIVIVYAMSKHFDFPLKEIIIENIVAILAIGLTYFLFSTFFIGYYKSADPNFVKKKILLALQTKSKLSEAEA